MSNYFIIHGSFSSPIENWFIYLRKEIEKRGYSVYTPDFPVGINYQNYDNWEKLLKVYLEAGLINENTVIFAHSIGPIFIINFLINNKIKVKRLVFVCGFNNYFGINQEYDSVNKTMYADNIEEIKNYCKDIICYYSDNDPYVDYKTEKSFADIVSNQQHMIKNGGHLNSESGYTEFKELLEYVH